ncbi:thiamine pyrophosphate-binding protein [Streptomyces chartreusis]|uniref:thiamine pyrophosphate-binding protein n=1 Tax=Streptomyces chartreusis TaxID=1969 RepID=UPI00123D2F11|nr:thiamine pyrophosphate-binding protein [Streptomyces chartreusis]QEV65441.1 thiamine pyrophosphate-binding protein [Streptomyces chartreusis]GGW92579.1 acetolactate synthase, large subunit, biosynthetic type [Streptomyces chartreusis]
MSAWDLIARTIADAGCRLVVGLPSDEPGLLDAADRHPDLEALGVRDQRVGACAAIGHTAVSGRPAVLALNSGPSFVNALTGLLEASSLGCSTVVITTRIPASELGRGGFQQLDQLAMAAPLARWSFLVEQADQLVWALRRALHMAVNGAPGVVVLEIAHEVLESNLTVAEPMGSVRRLGAVASDEAVEEAARLLRHAQRAVVVAGGGAKAAGAGEVLLGLAERLDAPLFTTASGRGVIDENHPLAQGLIGLYTSPAAQPLLDDADLVFVIGSRLEETARMGWFSPSTGRLIQLDSDPAAFSLVAEADVNLLGDATLTLRRLLGVLGARDLDATDSAWRRRIGQVQHEPRPAPGAEDMALSAPDAITATIDAFGRDLILVPENGLHDMWGYYYPVVSVSDRSTVISPGEQTMVGFGLGAALGAAVTDRSRPTVVICGDGAAEMSLAALPTAAEQNCGITVLMLDNRGFGWPRFVRSHSDSDDSLTRFATPSHVGRVVESLGGWTAGPATRGELATALEKARLVTADGGIALISVRVADDDIAPGVLRAFEPPDSAGQGLDGAD